MSTNYINTIQPARVSDAQLDSPVRQPEVTSEMAGLAKNIEELFSQISLLEDKLTPVLSLRPSGAEPQSAQPDVQLAPLAMEARDLKRRVAAVGSKVAQIIDRIEVS